MGFEAFGFTAHLEGNPDPSDIARFLEAELRFEQVSGGMAKTTAERGHFESGKCDGVVIEARIVSRGLEVSVEMEFALCNPDNIDSLFQKKARELLSRYPAEIWMSISALEYGPHYMSDQTSLFLERLPEEIEACRKVWRQAFGDKVGPVSVAEAYDFIGFGE